MPGFINLKLSGSFLAAYLNEMRTAEAFGLEKSGEGKTIVVDYGGPNVAKPLHIGHLRSAIIGESLKRLYKFFGYNTIGDVHLGDWGLQMGLIITELQERKPDLPYFDESYTGELIPGIDKGHFCFLKLWKTPEILVFFPGWVGVIIPVLV